MLRTQTGGRSEVESAKDPFDTGTYEADACWEVTHLRTDGVLTYEQRLTLLAQQLHQEANRNSASPSLKFTCNDFINAGRNK